MARHDKYFLIDFRGQHDNVTVDRLKAAHICFEALNQPLSDLSPSIGQQATQSDRIGPVSQSPDAERDITNITRQPSIFASGDSLLTSPLVETRVSRHGRLIRRPGHLNDYVP